MRERVENMRYNLGDSWEALLSDDPFARPKRRPSECVYFIQAKTVGLIKIGITTDVVRRMCTLQVGSPDVLELLSVEPSDDPAALESSLHGRFWQERAHGEWFRPSATLMAYVTENGMSLADYDRWRGNRMVERFAAARSRRAA